MVMDFMHRILFMGDFNVLSHKKFILKGILLFLIAGMLVLFSGRFLTPKFLYMDMWPTTSTHLGFYQMEKDTIDVLFLGSSHAVSAFNPHELYNQYGITSYNLGSEQQNLVMSYYWLKEALRYQSPKAVILECYFLFPYDTKEPLNTEEAFTRKSLDYMRWSSVKREAVRTVCSIDEKQSALSYYLPVIRYHARWKHLEENDFTLHEMERHYELKGFTPLTWNSNAEYEPFLKGSSTESESMEELMKEYLKKMILLCRNNGIELILVKTPSVYQDIGRYNAIQEIADEYQLLFYDFNEKELYEETAWDFAVDNVDQGHVSLCGSVKLASRLGKILQDVCKMEGRTDEQWEKTRQYYEQVQKDFRLRTEEDFCEYLDMLDDPRYVVFMAVKDEASKALDGEMLSGLKKLGLDAALAGQSWCSYIAVTAPGTVIEKAEYGRLEEIGTIREGRSSYTINSAGFEHGNSCSVLIDGTEYAVNHRGLNIVVYNQVSKKVIDSVCFNTHEESCSASR